MARNTPFHLIPQRFIIYIPFDEVVSPTSSPPFSLFLKQHQLLNGKYRNFLYGSFPTCAHLPVVSSSPDWHIGQWLMRFSEAALIPTVNIQTHSWWYSVRGLKLMHTDVCTLIIACRGKVSFLMCVLLLLFLEIEYRTSLMLAKCSASELHLRPPNEPSFTCNSQESI